MLCDIHCARGITLLNAACRTYDASSIRIGMTQLPAKVTSVLHIPLRACCIQKTRGRVVPKHTYYILYIVRCISEVTGKYVVHVVSYGEVCRYVLPFPGVRWKGVICTGSNIQQVRFLCRVNVY